MLKKDKTIKIKQPTLFQVVPGFSVGKNLYGTIKEKAIKDGFKVSYIKEDKPIIDKPKNVAKKLSTKCASVTTQRMNMNNKVFKEHGHTLTDHIEQFLFSNLVFFVETEFQQVMGETWNKHIKTIKRYRLYKRLSLYGIRRFLFKMTGFKLTTMTEFMKYDASYIKSYIEVDKIYNWYKDRDDIRNKKEITMNKAYDILKKIENERCRPYIKDRLDAMYSTVSGAYLSFYHWFFENHTKIIESVIDDLKKQEWYIDVNSKISKHFKQQRTIEASNEKEDTLMMHRIITYRSILWS